MTQPRKRLTPKVKKCLWLRQDKRCTDCKGLISLDDLDADHSNPLWCTGSNSPSNFQLLCQDCHDVKTKRESTARGKTKRLAQQTAGIAKKRRGRKLESKPFDKTMKRPFGDKVEVRK